MEIAGEMGQCPTGGDRRGDAVLGPRGSVADMSTLEIRAGFSFGVNSEQCGGWWDRWGEMEKKWVQI